MTLKKNFNFLFTLKLILICLLFLSNNKIHAQKNSNKLEEIVKKWASPGYYPDHIILSSQEDPSNSIGINWRTTPKNDIGYVEIAVAGDGPNFKRYSKIYPAKRELINSEFADKNGFESSFFEVTINDLIPNTIFAYRVGNDFFKSEWQQFKTATNNKITPVSFLYVGDAQNYILELWSRVIRTAYKNVPNADFFIHAGDLVNEGHSELEWNEWFAAGSFIHSEIPSIAVPGNHEYRPLFMDNSRGKSHLSVQWSSQFSYPKNGPSKLYETCYYIDYPRSI